MRADKSTPVLSGGVLHKPLNLDVMKDDIKDLLGGWHDMAVKAGHAFADRLDALIDNWFPRD